MLCGRPSHTEGPLYIQNDIRKQYYNTWGAQLLKWQWNAAENLPFVTCMWRSEEHQVSKSSVDEPAPRDQVRVQQGAVLSGKVLLEVLAPWHRLWPLPLTQKGHEGTVWQSWKVQDANSICAVRSRVRSHFQAGLVYVPNSHTDRLLLLQVSPAHFEKDS